MADIGLVTGNSVDKNIDGDTNVRLLQAEISDPDDVQNVELGRVSGIDSCPANDSNIIIIQISDNWAIAVACDDTIDPSVNPGEIKIYSYDPTLKTEKMYIHLKADGQLDLSNGTASITIDATNKVTINNNLTVDV